jgi:DNA-binding NarL/FixJ family response regulator
VLAGPTGVGKTRLARELLVGADRRGRVTRWVTATQAARVVPLGAFAAVVGDTDGPPDVSTLGRASALVQREIDLLVVDDAHLLDEVSATLLHQLAVSRAAGLIVTVRAGEPTSDAVTALWKDGLLIRLDVAPLGEPAIGELLESVLGGRVEEPSRHRLFEATRGNVLWLRHLVQGELAAARLSEASGVWRWSGEPRLNSALTGLINARIGELPAPLGRVLELLAFGEPLGLGLLATLVELDALAEAEQRQLVSVEATGRRREARLAHPLYGEAVRGRATPLRARQLRGQLAAALAATGSRRAGDLLRRAVLALDSDLRVDPALLTAAGHEAAALTDVALAQRLFRVARDAGGGFESQLGLGFTLSWVFRAAEAEVELARAMAAAENDAQRARAAVQRICNLHFMLARPDSAADLLVEAEESMPPGVARSSLDGVRAAVAAASNRLGEAVRYGPPVLDSAENSGAAAAWAGLGMLLATGYGGRAGELDQLAARAHAAARSARESAPLQLDILLAQVVGLTLAGWPDRAHERAARLGEFRGTHAALFRDVCGARIALSRGQLLTAARLFEAPGAFLPGHGAGLTTLAATGLAQARAMAGDPVGASAALARAEKFRHPGHRLIEPELMLARGWLAAAEGAVSEAVGHARRAAELAAESEQYAVEVLARHTAVCFGDPTQAAGLAELATRVDGPRAPAAAAHAAAHADGDPDALLAASARLDEIELVLFAADAAAQAATLWRSREDKARAAFAVARAAALARRCDDARTPALIAASWPLPVTAREREIATLAAGGLTNKQIAARLYVSVRTVEGHIYRVCTRLDLPDRNALAAVFGAAPIEGAGR